jgi:glycosyltransferase involved in cell wall biosynthesis
LYYNLAQIPLFLRFFWHIFDVFNKRSYFAIRKILKKEKPDIVMTHNLKGLGYLIPRAIKKSGIKWIHTIHDVQLVEPSGVIMSRSSNPPALRATSFIKEVYMRICRWLFDSPDRVVSPSKWLMDFYSEKGFFAKSRKVVMPNPVDIATRNLATRGIATGNLATRDMEDINFLYLGQIEEHKGVLFLIEVFKKFLNQKSEIKNLKLLIAGPGSKLEEIKKLAADEPRIKILGRVPHEQIAELLGQADFTIVPSLCYENSPTVITESFSFGVPVITARIGGAAELVREGVNGFIFEAGSEEDLLRALRLAVEKRNDFKKEEIRKTVEEFGVRKYVEKLLNL